MRRKALVLWFGVVVVFLFGGNIFGYSSLEPVLLREGVFEEECASNEHDPDRGCPAQIVKLNLFFTIGQAGLNVCHLLGAYLLSRTGMRFSAFIGLGITAGGFFLMSLASSMMVFVGFVMLGVGSGVTLLVGLQLRMVFPYAHSTITKGTVNALMIGAFDVSSVLFIIVNLLYFPGGVTYRPMLIIISILCFAFAFPLSWFLFPSKKEFEAAVERINRDDELDAAVDDLNEDAKKILASGDFALSHVHEHVHRKNIRRTAQVLHQREEHGFEDSVVVADEENVERGSVHVISSEDQRLIGHDMIQSDQQSLLSMVKTTDESLVAVGDHAVSVQITSSLSDPKLSSHIPRFFGNHIVSHSSLSETLEVARSTSCDIPISENGMIPDAAESSSFAGTEPVGVRIQHRLAETLLTDDTPPSDVSSLSVPGERTSLLSTKVVADPPVASDFGALSRILEPISLVDATISELDTTQESENLFPNNQQISSSSRTNFPPSSSLVPTAEPCRNDDMEQGPEVAQETKLSVTSVHRLSYFRILWGTLLCFTRIDFLLAFIFHVVVVFRFYFYVPSVLHQLKPDMTSENVNDLQLYGMFRSVLTFFLGSQSDAELFNRIFGFVLPVGGVFATILVTWMVNKLVHRIDLQYVFVWLNILFLSIFNVIPSLWAQLGTFFMVPFIRASSWTVFLNYSALQPYAPFSNEIFSVATIVLAVVGLCINPLTDLAVSEFSESFFAINYGFLIAIFLIGVVPIYLIFRERRRRLAGSNWVVEPIFPGGVWEPDSTNA